MFGILNLQDWGTSIILQNYIFKVSLMNNPYIVLVKKTSVEEMAKNCGHNRCSENTSSETKILTIFTPSLILIVYYMTSIVTNLNCSIVLRKAQIKNSQFWVCESGSPQTEP